MISIEHAKKLRKAIEKLSVNLTDTEALTAVELFPAFDGNSFEYIKDDRVQFEGQLYKCLISHTSQPSWNPPDAPSLWVRVDDPSQEYPDWVQPTGSTDAYMAGDKVTHMEKHWISDMDYNVYEPSVYGWSEVED